LLEEIRPADPSDPEAPARLVTTVGDTTGGDPPVGDGATGPGPYPGSNTATCTGSSGGEGQPPAASAPPVPTAAPRPRMVRSLVIGSVIAIALAVLLFVGLRPDSSKGSAGPLVPVGSQAPGFSLPPLAGSVPVDLDALGKDAHHPVILNFFASWCIPCQKETPLLAKAAAAEQAKGGPVRFVGVDVNDPPANALPFVQKAGITYPVGVDQTFRVTSGLYGLYGLPQTFFIGSDGKVLAHTIGAVDAADLRSWMKKLGEEGVPRT
jgi:cytochrome c biogenesis protein CcmG/thiol:disulfide interchange protein DsbE